MLIWDGMKLTKAREERLWNREEMAEAWFKKYKKRISVVSISYWERGIKPPGRNNVLKLAGLFEKPIEYFFTNQALKNRPTRRRSKSKKLLNIFKR